MDARNTLITDSPGDNCVRIGRLSYKISKEYDVAEDLYKILCTAMIHLEGNHPIRSHKGLICYTSSSVGHIYPGGVWAYPLRTHHSRGATQQRGARRSLGPARATASLIGAYYNGVNP